MFRFQQFDIEQSASVFRVGTDAVLLGAMASPCEGNILEVGTGTGIISMMLAQRTPNAHITALDISQEACRLATHNFQRSPFSERLRALHQDFKRFSSVELFSQVVSNPPYFEVNHSQKDVLARQKVELNFVQLIEKTAVLLSLHGIFSVIIPAQEEEVFSNICTRHGLFLNRKINIYGIKGGSLRRNVLEYSKAEMPVQSQDFVIEDHPRHYSQEYRTLTQAFHIFKGE